MRIEQSSVDRHRARPRSRPRLTLGWAISSALVRVVLLLVTVLLPTSGLPISGAAAQTSPACEQRGTQELFVVDADGGAADNVTKSGTFNYLPAWSADGTQLAFMTTRDCDAEVYVSDADGTNPRNLTNSPGYDTMPVWSPDGTRLAFVVQDGENSDIYVMDADGGNRANLTASQAYEMTPAWSPDGTRLAFASDQSGEFQIHLIDVASSARSVIQLTETPGPKAYPSWAPDGDRLAFVTAAGEIGVVDADGGAIETLFADVPIGAQDVAWSPAGDRLAFTSGMEGNRDIYVTDLNGHEVVNLTQHPANDGSPAWSPDGTRIVFSSSRYVAAADGPPVATPVAGTGEAAPVDDLFACASRIEVVGATWHLRSDCTVDYTLVLLDGVTFDGHGHTMWVMDGETDPFNGNVIERSGGSASVANVTIDGSQLTLDCLQGQYLNGVRFFDVEGTVANVTVQHLLRDQGTGCGFGIVVEGPTTADAGPRISNTTVEDSTIRRVGGNGIFVWDTVNVTITGNLVDDAGQRGIAFLGPGATGTVSGNSIAGAGHIGIGIEGSQDLVVSDNTVTDSTTAGIVVHGGATNVRLERNRIQAARYGVIFDSASTSGAATANQVTDMAVGGIFAIEGAEATVSGNHISNVDGSGIASLSGATVTATRNRIYRAERGLVVSEVGSSGDYQDNIVSESADAGVMIDDGGRATLRRNRVTGGITGIHVSGATTTAEVSHSMITGVASTGVMVIDQAAATIGSNDIRNPGAVGVLISGAGTTSTVNRNTITRLDPVPVQQPTAGIVVRAGAHAEVIDNTISGYVDNGPRDWCGIDVQPGSGNVHLKGNEFPGTDWSSNMCFPGSDEFTPMATPVATPA